MKIQMISNGHKTQELLLKRCIDERIPSIYETGGMQITLDISSEFGVSEGYLIEQEDNGWKITGSDDLGLFYGIGKFLHTAKWTKEEFVPNPPIGFSSPDCNFRVIYPANHFNNWYQEAPEDELQRYMEDLLLWGYNAVITILPVLHFGGKDDPGFQSTLAASKAMLRAAKKCNMKVGIICNPNQGTTTAPHEFDAERTYDPMGFRGNLGRNICASNPEAVEYLRSVWNTLFEAFMDIGLDYVATWPYDEGGCGCENCRPWGAKGYPNLMIEMNKEAKKYYPNCKIVASTWYFDEPEEGEFKGFYERLKTDLDFVDYVMADSFDSFPEYPLEHEPVKPVVSFPEISMWKLYPWGGRGANPQPKRFQRIWNSAKHVLQGGMPYSEGIFEDILKVQFAGYFWDKDRHYREILAEYINYEYSGDVCAEVLEMMELIEINHVTVGGCMLRSPAVEIAERASKLADEVDSKLSERAKKAWRWRILYIRTKIDEILYKYFVEHFGSEDKAAIYELHKTPKEFLEHSDEAQKLLYELVEIYHCIPCPAEYRRVYPPIKERTIIRTIDGKKVSVNE